MTLVRRGDAGEVASVRGALVLYPQAPGFETLGNASTPLYGTADVDLGAIGAHRAGDTLSDAAEGPGVLVLEFERAGGTVPVENTGGPGTVNSHWRKSVFGGELMMGTFSASAQHPMSAITVQSMSDLGYTVDAGAADRYALPASSNARTTPALVGDGTMGDGIPLKCVVTGPVMAEVTVIELKSEGHP